MKNHKLLFYIIAFLLFVSFSIKHDSKNLYPAKIIVSGKIIDFNPQKVNVEILVYRLGFEPERIYADIDSLGYFKGSFESDIPTDLRLTYNSGIWVITHPGDSIFVEIDGKLKDRPDILKTVKFSGDRAKTNQNMTSFQEMYFSSSLFLDDESKKTAIKDYDVDKFVEYLDSVKLKIDNLLNDFSEKYDPNKESKKWAQLFIEQQEYFDLLCFYPLKHQRFNQLKSSEWEVPEEYYNLYLKRLPLSESMLISAFALNNFVNRYTSFISNKKNKENSKYVYKKDFVYFVAPAKIADSISIHSIIKHTKDDLLKQLSLVQLFESEFKKSEIDLLENYRYLVDSLITKPYLKEPLMVHYKQIKANIDRPDLKSATILKEISNSSSRQIMDSVILKNKGKIIYIDCWATWCGPCLSEMPNSKELMKKMKGRDVAFVYMCLDSEEKQWKAHLAEMQLTGQQYFLTKEQSTDIRKVYEINGIPHYILIDKKGIIVEKGSHLRPNNVENKIDKLLKE